jgi:hypothetical protein
MNERTGKIMFFWTLVGVFFAVSGLIISYAFGYRYNLENGIFVYGGSVTVKTSPQEVNVAINEVPIPLKKLNRINNSYHIDGIKPGDYTLKVSAPGFVSWSKHIEVHSGLSTEFWNILLPRDSYERLQYDTPNAGKFFISPRKNLIAYTQQNEKEFSVGILEPETKNSSTVFSSPEYIFTSNEKENIEWSPETHRLIIPAIKNDNTKHYFVVATETLETIDLKDVTGTDRIYNVRWDSDTKNALFFMSESNLYRIDLDNPSEIKQIAQNIASYDLSSKGLYYLQLPEGIVYHNNFTGTGTPEQITASGPSDMSDPMYQIVIYDEDRITFLNNSGNLYIYNKGELNTYFELLSNNIKGSQFSDDGKKLLFWSDREISAYFFREWEVQPTRKENERYSITRFADAVRNVQWTRDYEHALFSVNKNVKIAELDQRDSNAIMDVLALGNEKSNIMQNFSDGNLYFTNPDPSNVTTIFSIIFPEKTGILGFGG